MIKGAVKFKCDKNGRMCAYKELNQDRRVRTNLQDAELKVSTGELTDVTVIERENGCL